MTRIYEEIEAPMIFLKTLTLMGVCAAVALGCLFAAPDGGPMVVLIVFAITAPPSLSAYILSMLRSRGTYRWWPLIRAYLFGFFGAIFLIYQLLVGYFPHLFPRWR